MFSSHRATWTLSLLFLAAYLHPGRVHADTYCVTAGDTAALKAALTFAESNGADDVIELQGGTYSLTSAETLRYYPNTEQHDLTIEGGYSDFFGNPCGLAPASPDARGTVIDGGQLELTLPGGSGSITIRGITVSNAISSNQWPVPVAVGGLAGSTGNISIFNSMFLGNVSVSNQAVALGAVDGSLSIQNVVFASNGTLTGDYPVAISGFRMDPNALCVSVVNSTFTNNTSSGPAVGFTTPFCLAVVANDVFWGDASGDVEFGSPSMVYVANSDFGDLTEIANTNAVAVLNIDPMFNSDFSLDNASRLHDAGSKGGFIFTPAQFDAFGNPRVVGAMPDVGAYETQDDIFGDYFD